jgi:hypothetical protein
MDNFSIFLAFYEGLVLSTAHIGRNAGIRTADTFNVGEQLRIGDEHGRGKLIDAKKRNIK